MKEKLEKTGKLCAFKNYDLMPAKNDFNFEMRDWMSVRLEELPNGSQLIMGLNPPFGVKAYEFIQSALKFRPKLIILIVPKETRRLDGISDYDLIWEDDELLSGKSFYLPGSVDVYDKPLEQWNLNTPPLYLWSRSDWTARHKAIAQKCNDMPKMQEEMHRKETDLNQSSFNHPINCTLPCKQKENDLPEYSDIEVGNHRDQGMKQSYENLNESMQEGRNLTGMSLPEKQEDGLSVALDDMCIDMELSSPINCTDFRSMFDNELVDGIHESSSTGRNGIWDLTSPPVHDNVLGLGYMKHDFGNPFIGQINNNLSSLGQPSRVNYLPEHHWSEMNMRPRLDQHEQQLQVQGLLLHQTNLPAHNSGFHQYGHLPPTNPRYPS